MLQLLFIISNNLCVGVLSLGNGKNFCQRDDIYIYMVKTYLSMVVMNLIPWTNTF